MPANMPANSAYPLSPRPQLLVLDLDGTLIDSVPDLATALGLAMTDLGLPPPGVPAVRAMVGDGQRVLVQRALSAVGAELSKTDAVLARYRHHYSEHLFDVTACYPGVVETLRQLPAEIHKGVATNKPGQWARSLTAHFELGLSQRWVLGEDDLGARKPDPGMLLHLCKQAQVEPSRALMVGDSRIDLEAGAAAGMPVALCTYGYCDQETLAAARTAQAAVDVPLGSRLRPHLLETFADLLTLIAADPA